MTSTLVFVYAVDGGVINMVWDTLHKLASPSTYSCNLCKLTSGPAGDYAAWKRAVENLARPTVFLHRDELRAQYGSVDAPLPAVFVQRGDGLELLIPRDEIQACETLDALIALVATRAAALAS